MSDEIQTMTINDFRQLGYLQEVNRLVLHRLGLALAVSECVHNGHLPSRCQEPPTLGVIWDYRDDEEGLLFDFSEGHPFTVRDAKNAIRIEQEMKEKDAVREEKYGWKDGIQPATLDGAPKFVDPPQATAPEEKTAPESATPPAESASKTSARGK